MRYQKKHLSSLPVVLLLFSLGLMMSKPGAAQQRETFSDVTSVTLRERSASPFSEKDQTIQTKTPDPMSRLKFESEDNGLPHSSTGGATRFAEQINFQPPADQGAPEQSVGGSTRGGSGKVCPQDRNAGFSARTLKAVLPESKQGLTVSSHPTFLLYVPQTSAGEVRFILQDDSNPNQTIEIYETKFALPKDLTATGGLVTIEMPENLPELEIGKTYSYYAALICSPGDSGDINYDRGFVTRVEVPGNIAQVQGNEALSPEQSLWQQAMLYAESGIWLDTVSSLLSLMEHEPNNQALQDRWVSLMRSDAVNLDEAIAKAKIVHLSNRE